ncbi:MAG: hypothetical protein B0W54_10410 [Cellvibrio sp. 79]|nr:MAG: hypothetical protein B0W54_10410 [Cellvibrio sp. 79]
MSTIKIYFCKIFEDGDSDIAVYRDIGLVRSEWDESDKSFVGVLHAGMSRPYFSFSSNLWQYNGQILISPSLRWSLPSEYECSVAVAGEIKINDAIAPVYLIKRGFNYLTSEPNDIASVVQTEIQADEIYHSVLKLLESAPRPLSIETIFSELCEKGLYKCTHDTPVTRLLNIIKAKHSDEITVSQVTDKFYISSKSMCEMTGWIRNFVSENPEKSNALRVHGIYDEASYSAASDGLPEQLNCQMEFFRYHFLLNHGCNEDPEQLLKIIPGYISSLHISTFGFTARVLNVLKSKSIDSLSDLHEVTFETMSKWDNFGRGSARAFCKTIMEYIDKQGNKPVILPMNVSNSEEASEDNRSVHYSEMPPLKECFEKSLMYVKERDRLIIEYRTGLYGPSKTLQEVGDLLNVTRERVRQIQSKYIRKIIETESWDDHIAIKIGQLLLDRKSPLYLEMLEIEDSWFKGFIGNYQNLAALIELFSEDEIRVIKINGANVITRIKQDEWVALISRMRQWLKDISEKGSWNRADIEMTFQASLMEKTCAELLPLMWGEFSGALQFSNDERDGILVSVGKTAEAAIAAVLHQAEKPLHYSEIAARATELLGKPVDDRRAHGAAPGLGAKLFGRGIYGFEHLNPISNRMCDNIRLVVVRMIYQGDLKKQWHCSEILDQLQKQFPALPTDLDHYILNMILEKSEKLTYLNRMVWARADSGQTKDDRIDMADAFTKILEDHGGPLKGSTLKEKLQSIRGVPSQLQIQPTERMILIGPDFWGLIDRDIEIDEITKQRYLDILYSHLSTTQKGLHVSEASRILDITETEQLNSYIIFNIAQRDVRFYLARAMFLGLSGWGEDVRRLNFTQAVRAVIDQMQAPMTIIQINSKVEELTGLSIDGSVTSLLINEGARYDSTTRLWFSHKNLN